MGKRLIDFGYSNIVHEWRRYAEESGISFAIEDSKLVLAIEDRLGAELTQKIRSSGLLETSTPKLSFVYRSAEIVSLAHRTVPRGPQVWTNVSFKPSADFMISLARHHPFAQLPIARSISGLLGRMARLSPDQCKAEFALAEKLRASTAMHRLGNFDCAISETAYSLRPAIEEYLRSSSNSLLGFSALCAQDRSCAPEIQVIEDKSRISVVRLLQQHDLIRKLVDELWGARLISS